KDRYGNGKIIVNKISIFDEYDNELTEILAGQKIKIRLWFNRNSNENISVIPSIGFVNQFDQIIFSHHSRLVGMVFNNLGKSGFFEFEIESLAIVPGNYKIAYSLISNGVFIDSIDVAKKIQIISSNFYGYGEMLPATHTLILLNGKWKMYDEDKS
ncbi:MAG: Wzt carbohydrate-binding domain-containing protein, partial [Bacteroidales bacterium]